MLLASRREIAYGFGGQAHVAEQCELPPYKPRRVLSLSGIRGEPDARRINLTSRLLDRSRPLWCLTLFKGLPGRSLVLGEMHHAIVDYVSGFDLLNKTMDVRANPAPIEPPATGPHLRCDIPSD